MRPLFTADAVHVHLQTPLWPSGTSNGGLPYWAVRQVRDPVDTSTTVRDLLTLS